MPALGKMESSFSSDGWTLSCPELFWTPQIWRLCPVLSCSGRHRFGDGLPSGRMKTQTPLAARGRAASSLMHARGYAVAAIGLDRRRATGESAEQDDGYDKRK